MGEASDKLLWWQKGTIYQVYPRSFMDSNGDGVGDLQGIISRLDYLEWLGVSAVWVSPIYPSPMADFGYDISDYTAIHPMFGSMDDFDELLAEVHRRNLKLILDLVPNHTSSEHPWFKESRSSRNNPKRDWYLWQDPAPDGGPPNNWLSTFGGSAWEKDEQTGQYYYHAYLKEQPDLNWRNPEVQEAMLDVMRFWLDKGVDGFRVDVMWHMIKDEQYRNNPTNPDYTPDMPPFKKQIAAYSVDQPEVHQVVTKMRHLLDQYEERVMIGEIYLSVDKLVTYYGNENDEAHLPFNFQLISLPWEARQIARAIDQYEGALPANAWPNWVLGNHDKPRIASRVGKPQARIAAMLLLTLRGTPTLYYGDELGMQDVFIPAGQVQDPWEKNEPGLGLGRDPVRTPMQWNAADGAGFTTATPWLPLSANYKEDNVEVEQQDSSSFLNFYRRLIALRQAEPALYAGRYIPLPAGQSVIAYFREAEGKRFLIVLNLSHSPASLTLKEGMEGEVVLSSLSTEEKRKVKGEISLRGDEGLIIGV
ncbi:alpha-amylase family glycosyl hydrolase [Nafulsella turpanensis]|uniref:alpha-amylase family glycosyl hydrolase n=1 Tax=Nafulsella turpanensis TaxID=1265690 RepID=UPI000366B45D|nr:alpha-amylase family glycosyl hydrolase [Nafulsella turpanensis]